MLQITTSTWLTALYNSYAMIGKAPRLSEAFQQTNSCPNGRMHTTTKWMEAIPVGWLGEKRYAVYTRFIEEISPPNPQPLHVLEWTRRSIYKGDNDQTLFTPEEVAIVFKAFDQKHSTLKNHIGSTISKPVANPFPAYLLNTP